MNRFVRKKKEYILHSTGRGFNAGLMPFYDRWRSNDHTVSESLAAIDLSRRGKSTICFTVYLCTRSYRGYHKTSASFDDLKFEILTRNLDLRLQKLGHFMMYSHPPPNDTPPPFDTLFD